MRRASKVDRNHQAIVEALRQVGCEVLSLARVGSGAPDLLVLFRGQLYLFEVKMGREKLREAQIAFARRWYPAVSLVRSVDDALAAIGAQSR